jgi:hypothetical protein
MCRCMHTVPASYSEPGNNPLACTSYRSFSHTHSVNALSIQDVHTNFHRTNGHNNSHRVDGSGDHRRRPLPLLPALQLHAGSHGRRLDAHLARILCRSTHGLPPPACHPLQCPVRCAKLPQAPSTYCRTECCKRTGWFPFRAVNGKGGCGPMAARLFSRPSPTEYTTCNNRI